VLAGVDCLGLFRREDVSGASQGEIDDVRLGLMRATTATSEPIFVAAYGWRWIVARDRLAFSMTVWLETRFHLEIH
jgi:hypothetical protein